MPNIHNHDQQLQNVKQKLRESDDYTEEETQALLDFELELRSQGIGKSKVFKYLSSFSTLGNYIGFDLLDPDKRELKELVAQINDNDLDKDYSVWTLKEFKVSLNKFYGFLDSTDRDELLDFMSVTISEKDKPKVKRSDLPGPEHVKEALTSLDKLRDRALIFLTWDSGARIGEVLNLKWKDIEFRENGLKVHIRESKSMQWEIFLGECQQTLREWKNQSEFDDRENYVFVKIGSKDQEREGEGNQLRYRAAKAVFDKLGRRLDSEVKTNPHAFRKARATYLASKGWNAAQLCEQFGWNDFETAEYYINLHKSDVETAMKDTLDIETEESDTRMSLAPSRCERCGELNPGHVNYCQECGDLISEEKELMLEQVKEEERTRILEDLTTELLEETDISREELSERIERKAEEQLEERGLL